ncbi:MAG: single-stranded DNA-binding protein [Bacteroidota bacterium]|nr:single-stranded DNA-binding protein [Bacteroidota bacterium]MDE2835672.1 single-stranded DNA-binding protein [Bacteroidota bacterium]MDE2955388.1 single-stranded DNA-binding protein [Bacteroidota bacterium]
MDIDINKVLVVGTLEEIDELRTFPTGSSLCSFTVVTVERFHRRGGETGERKMYHKITAWGELGKRVHAEYSRGMRVVVEGRLNRRSYEKNGETRWVTDIVASSCNALGHTPSSYAGAGRPAYSGGAQTGANTGYSGGTQPSTPPQRSANRPSYTSGPSQPSPAQTQPPPAQTQPPPAQTQPPPSAPPAAAPQADSGPLPDGEDDLPF